MQTYSENTANNKKPADRRVARTEQLLREALIALTLEKSYEKISVQDIIDRANVGRSTFYAHFVDKDALLVSGLGQLRELFEQKRQEILRAELQATRKHTEHPARLEMGLVLFDHIQTHRHLYRALLGKRSGELVKNQLYQYLSEIFEENLPQLASSTAKLPPKLVSHFLVSALLSLIEWWLDNDPPYSAEQMNQWFHELAMYPLMMK